MKYYIVAGERSGDLHGSNLIKGIRLNDENAQIRAFGGNLMADEGAEIVKNYKEMAFMGFWEVAKNVHKIFNLLSFCFKDIEKWQPDVVILIDYAGFNMRLAKKLKKIQVKTVYYISPKVWAWNQKRALKIKANIDRMYVILPFEVDFFAKYNMEVKYMGNPLMDAIENFTPNPNFLIENKLEKTPTIAILPGSRMQEIEAMLPVMLDSSLEFMDDYQIVLATVSNIPSEFYEEFLTFHKNVKVVTDSTYDLLQIAETAMVTSGTATLETALFQVPQVVCYKTSWLSAIIARAVIKVKFISLVNLILQKATVEELIQETFTVENLTKSMNVIKIGGNKREKMLEDYDQLKTLIGNKGASEKVGHDLVDFLRENK